MVTSALQLFELLFAEKEFRSWEVKLSCHKGSMLMVYSKSSVTCDKTTV